MLEGEVSEAEQLAFRVTCVESELRRHQAYASPFIQITSYLGFLLDDQMALQGYGGSAKVPRLEGTTEFEILKLSHQYVSSDFLRFGRSDPATQVPPTRRRRSQRSIVE